VVNVNSRGVAQKGHSKERVAQWTRSSGDKRAPGLPQAPSLDVAVIGGGVAGLTIASRLAMLGYGVALIEQGQHFGVGSSTRNEGWLHAGTFHATSVTDPEEAFAVARRCIYGFETIQRYAPECINDDEQSFAIVPESLLEHALERWDSCGVSYKVATTTQLQTVSTDVVLQPGDSLFAVRDVGINTRILMTRYLHDLQREGAGISLDARPVSWAGGNLTLRRRSGSLLQFRCGQLVVAAGYGCERLLADLGLPKQQFRYWKSHLCISPRLSHSAIFSIASGEAAMMTHQDKSITGLNQDATPIERPNFEPTEEGMKALGKALKERFRCVPSDLVRFTACTKLDLVEDTASARSLNVCVRRIAQDAIIALPGKMTETPYVADQVVRELFGSLERSSMIAMRPMDAA
jgi:glycerol-3-phosphate dehydrogenase